MTTAQYPLVMSIHLQSLFPLQVRKTTADQLYITMVTYDDIIEEHASDGVIAVLSDTAW